jgi:hypothetical protein
VCNIYCPWGNVTDANGCQLCQCKPAPACTQNECGPPPPFAQPICQGGTVIAAKCVRGTDDKCSWQGPICSCPDIVCPAIACPAGSAAKAAPPTCQTCGCGI